MQLPNLQQFAGRESWAAAVRTQHNNAQRRQWLFAATSALSAAAKHLPCSTQMPCYTQPWGVEAGKMISKSNNAPGALQRLTCAQAADRDWVC